jgi:hypothetical protein
MPLYSGREQWVCPKCGQVSHVIAGQDNAENHQPFCTNPNGEPLYSIDHVNDNDSPDDYIVTGLSSTLQISQNTMQTRPVVRVEYLMTGGLALGMTGHVLVPNDHEDWHEIRLTLDAIAREHRNIMAI